MTSQCALERESLTNCHMTCNTPTLSASRISYRYYFHILWSCLRMEIKLDISRAIVTAMANLIVNYL